MNPIPRTVIDFRDRVVAAIARSHLAVSAGRAAQLLTMEPPDLGWKLVARIKQRGVPTETPDFWFQAHALRLGAEHIELAENDPEFTIVRANVTSAEVQVWIMRTDASPSLQQSESNSDDRSRFSKLVKQLAGSFSDPARAIVARRVFRYVGQIVEQAPREVIAEAASAPSDTGVLFRTLEQPDALEQLKAEDPLAEARLRGLRERDKLLAAGEGTLTADQVAEHLHLTRQAVNRRRQVGALLGLDAGRHGHLYPAWQFERNGTASWLKLVLAALRDHDPWMKQAFMINRTDRLGGISPLDALRAGHLERVLRAAGAYGEHGAA